MLCHAAPLESCRARSLRAVLCQGRAVHYLLPMTTIGGPRRRTAPVSDPRAHATPPEVPRHTRRHTTTPTPHRAAPPHATPPSCSTPHRAAPCRCWIASLHKEWRCWIAFLRALAISEVPWHRWCSLWNKWGPSHKPQAAGCEVGPPMHLHGAHKI